MLVPLRWLREYVDINIMAEELAELLTMTGTKVEGITRTAESLSGIVSARVESIVAHKTMHNLSVGKLWTPDREYTVVTGAKNVSVGDVVPLAVPGAVMLDGSVIRTTEFSGVVSEGMMCSAKELGISEEAEGILVLSASCLAGIDIASAFDLKDDVLELEITPNRPDCLGILGLAREVAAITRMPIKWPQLDYKSTGDDISDFAAAAIHDKDLCSRYALKAFSDVKVAPSPIWMQVRLTAAGIRPISNVVDVTNYVMLDVNQPLHAFDYDRLEGGRIIVRKAAKGEVVTTLDGQERPVEEGMLLICDARKPVAVAGVMGGAESEISGDTKRVLLESANFTRQSVWRTSKSLKLRTESSTRFEKGLDPQTVPLALERSAHLIDMMGAARVNPGRIDVNYAGQEKKLIATTRGWITRSLGTDLGRKVDEYLALIGLDIEDEQQGDRIVAGVPSWRADLNEPIDLVEEVARMHGYNNLASCVPANLKPSDWTEDQKGEKDLKQALLSMGMYEAMTYNLVPEEEARIMGYAEGSRERDMIFVINPLSEDQSALRTSLLPSLLRVADTNFRRGASAVSIFEMARVYLKKDTGLGSNELPRGERPIDEPLRLAGVLAGNSIERAWHSKARQYDFFDVKGIIESVLATLGIQEYSVSESEEPFLRPGRRGRLDVKRKIAGHFGQIHPDVAESFGLPEETMCFELDALSIIHAIRKDMSFKGIPKHPSTDRDIAMILDKSVSAQQVAEYIKIKAGSIVEEVSAFDVYEGQGITAGKRSIAFTVKYRSKDKTLTSDEVNELHGSIREGLVLDLGAQLR